MANGTTTSTSQQPTSQPDDQSKQLRAIAVIILTLTLVFGLLVLIASQIIKPMKMEYSIEHGSLKTFNQSQTNHQEGGAQFDFVIRARNPNIKISIDYNFINLWLYYGENMLFFKALDSFHQPRQSVSRIQVSIEGGEEAAMVETGQLLANISINAMIRFEVGAIKFKPRPLFVDCYNVEMKLSSSSQSTGGSHSCDLSFRNFLN